MLEHHALQLLSRHLHNENVQILTLIIYSRIYYLDEKVNRAISSCRDRGTNVRLRVCVLNTIVTKRLDWFL